MHTLIQNKPFGTYASDVKNACQNGNRSNTLERRKNVHQIHEAMSRTISEDDFPFAGINKDISEIQKQGHVLTSFINNINWCMMYYSSERSPTSPPSHSSKSRGKYWRWWRDQVTRVATSWFVTIDVRHIPARQHRTQIALPVSSNT